LGGHGSGGGGGGRSLRSTQGFGPKTYDPYNILNPKGNGDWKIHSNDNSSIYWSCVIGNGSAFKIPNLASAKPLNSNEQQILQNLMNKSPLLKSTYNTFLQVATKKNKSLNVFSIIDDMCWAEINKNNINQYNIYLSNGMFDGTIQDYYALYLFSHEFFHFIEWLNRTLSNASYGTKRHRGKTYTLLKDEVEALQFGNSILSDYYQTNSISNRLYFNFYLFTNSNGSKYKYIIPNNDLFNPIKGKY
ncbi:MAG TPA: hypothetical protein PLE30_03930, partial [Candidatus Kapabacteria bacterium]|nr:hypothetical protein [Candidatus Kapabacteria bacterium]